MRLFCGTYCLSLFEWHLIPHSNTFLFFPLCFFFLFIYQTLEIQIAGTSTEFVNKVLEKVKSGIPNGGLHEIWNHKNKNSSQKQLQQHCLKWLNAWMHMARTVHTKWFCRWEWEVLALEFYLRDNLPNE